MPQIPDFQFDPPQGQPFPTVTRRPFDEPLADFQVFGERNSGTNFVEQLVERNFDLERVQLYGWKHGFPVSMGYHRRSLILFVYRDPIDWTVSMFNTPHAPHPDVKLDSFSEFIRSEWAIFNRRNSRRVWRQRWNATSRGELDFMENTFDRHPETGKRFRNVMEMRRSKLVAGLSFRNRICNLIIASYEDIRTNKEPFLDYLSAQFDIPRSDTFDPIEDKVSPDVRAKKTFKRADISPEDFAYLAAELDADVEAQLGYAITP
ncbi:hypothetical protein [Gymnodinialimonas ceratoperidinii]|uniref:Sulfotransferase domain-containing protein n=1 Tax=Gymnodinialimonas ceratoperidinii TaxID=2856823 RepID=A0A8F6TYT3_9RHOB|nr:hypothetical protein [Gymnodinialimonas ceratoperidinii]QXT40232.1 hypothetical protein KYE46_02980 [Gymnodinialimonas ceratoperidinii]